LFSISNSFAKLDKFEYQVIMVFVVDFNLVVAFEYGQLKEPVLDVVKFP